VVTTSGVVTPAAADSVSTDCGATAGATSLTGSKVSASVPSGSRTRRVIFPVSPGASQSVVCPSEPSAGLKSTESPTWPKGGLGTLAIRTFCLSCVSSQFRATGVR
jgi:hypothetical protein